MPTGAVFRGAKLLCWMAFFVALLVSSTAFASSIQFRAEFDLRWYGMVAARTVWSVQETTTGTVVFASHTVPSKLAALYDNGEIIERSEWIEEAGQLHPLLYNYSRSGRKARYVRIRFDWEKRIAYHDTGGEPWQIEIPLGTLDKLSYVVAVMIDLSRGKQELNYLVADGKRLRYYHIEHLGEERIDTVLGTLDAHVLRYKGSNNRQTTFWCAPSLGYFPIRIVYREKHGGEFEAVARSLDMQPL